MFDYWKPILTDTFIKEIKAKGGILINLASGEMKDLFDWKRVEQEVQVITPEFQVWKKGKLTTVVVYAKMCRGELTRFIIKNRIENPLSHTTSWITQSAIPTNLLPNSGHASGMSCYTVL